jgi:hypothetical protein
MDSMTKRCGNALYGKFAQRNGEEVLCKLSEYPADVPEKVTILEYKNDLYVLTQNDKDPAMFEFPCISSFITSYAQLKLYNAIEANEDNIIYCDTDSVKVLIPAVGIPLGAELGDFKFEYEKDAVFYRPKFYDDKHKGVPKTCDYKELTGKCQCTDIKNCPAPLNYGDKENCHKAYVVERTPEHIQFRYEKPIREREAMRRNLTANKWHTVDKVLTFLDDKRVWHKDGTSEPVFINKGEQIHELATN